MNENNKSASVISVGKYMASLREHIGAHGRAWVEGELSEHTARRGHWYFTITDDSSSLNCVMWQSRTRQVKFKPEPGQLLRVYGGPTVYPKSCRLQFDVLRIERRQTLGELQKRFLELCEKFAQEGLFDEEKKKTLPQIPRSIGIVTSPEGAALQDILRILRDRFPMVEVILGSVRVQGSDAAPEIAEAIKQFNGLVHEKRPDLLIIGRGGGSLEDLWAFNEEIVARVLFQSQISRLSALLVMKQILRSPTLSLMYVQRLPLMPLKPPCQTRTPSSRIS
ncbi:MAG: exodeoxyribonuclease VII large subunit [Bacteroidetes bacterium]|nr:exodeoxyribonuclease VII large subunit [Bacteroidota bacterium]